MKLKVRLFSLLALFLLITVPSWKFSSASDIAPRTILVRKLDFTTQTSLDGGPLFVIRAKVSAENLISEQVGFEATIRRSDGLPLRLDPAAPNYLTEKNGVIIYEWTGPLQGLQALDDLFVPVPVSAVAGGSLDFLTVIRFKVVYGSLTSYLEAEVNFPRPDKLDRKQIRIGRLRQNLARAVQQTLNVAGMDAAETDRGKEIEVQNLSLDLEVSGIQGQEIYLGALFRQSNGEPVRPSTSCPPGNVGKAGQVQVQRSDAFQASPAELIDFSVQAPLHWMELDRSTGRKIIAGVYTSAGGLWGYAETELDLPPAGLAGITFSPAGPPEASGPSFPLFETALAGDTARLKQLIQSGADVRAPGTRGRVPLHAAAESGQFEAAKILVEADQFHLLRDGQLPASPEQVRDQLPTVEMIDDTGSTPLHLAARQGHQEISALLLENGADPEVPDFDGKTAYQLALAAGHSPLGRMLKEAGAVKPTRPSRTVSRYTVPLKDILIELDSVNKRLSELQKDPDPDQGAVRSLGQELARVIGTFQALFRNAPVTRIGLAEDLQLVKSISEVQSDASWRFQSMAIIPGEGRASQTTGRSPTILEDAGRMLIEKEVLSWLKRKGLGDILADGGRSRLTGSVNQRLQIDLKGFLDKKAQEVLGMPLRGLKSLQAAFRLQAQRHIRETIAQLVLNFTGNRLLLTMLQNTVLDWAENELWPQLREAFRPRGNLQNRVDVSIATMQEASRGLFRLSQGRDPGMIPLEEVLRALDGAGGTIHAARYLEKDLNPSGDQELKRRFFRELSQLRLAMRVVMGQFMIYDDEQDGEFAAFEIFNRFDYIEGIQEDVLDVLGRMGTEIHEMRIWNPSAGELKNGQLPFKPQYFQKFLIALYKMPDAQMTGIKRLNVWIHDQAFILYGSPDQSRKLIEFQGSLPMPPGQYTVRLECRDIPGVPQEELLFHVAADSSAEASRLMGRLQQNVSRAQQQAAKAVGDRRGSALLSLADRLRYAARQLMEMGNIDAAQSTAVDAESLALQSGSPDSWHYLAELYRLQGDIALLTADRDQHIRRRQMEIDARQKHIQYQQSQGRENLSAGSLAADAAFRTAEMLLVFGVNPAQVKSLVDLGLSHRSQSGQSQVQLSQAYPNLAVLFQVN